MRRLIAATAVALTLLMPTGIADAIYRCNTWYTIATTPRSYSPCNSTTLGAWWIAPGTGCLQWVSWRVYQQRINSTNRNYLIKRTVLHNEVRAQIRVGVGPLSYTQSYTITGSHTTTVISQYGIAGNYGGCYLLNNHLNGWTALTVTTLLVTAASLVNAIWQPSLAKTVMVPIAALLAWWIIAGCARRGEPLAQRITRTVVL